ncbi:hypothetical protein HZC34_01835 [Candidatus Saganbacteria bacterium]|nr:hypothetical protein [Candidatus Saganbacteria bacterium]
MSVEINLGVQAAGNLKSPKNLQAALKTAEIKVNDDNNPTVILTFLQQRAEGKYELIRVKQDVATLRRVAVETKEEDTAVARTLDRVRGTKDEAQATRIAAQYTRTRAKTQTIIAGRLPGIDDKTIASMIAQDLIDGSQALACTYKFANKDSLSNEDKKDLESANQELVAATDFLIDTSIKLGLNIKFEPVNKASENGEHYESQSFSLSAASDWLSNVIAAARKEINEALSKANRPDEKEDALLARKREEKIFYAKKLQGKIDNIIAAMKSATSKQQIMALVDEAKQAASSAREVLSSGVLPAEIKAGVESSVAVIEYKIEGINPKIVFTA